MPPRARRPQASDATTDDDLRPLVVRPLVQTDRVHNADDIEVDEAAIEGGIEHGGSIERRAEARGVRGSGGRKRTDARAPSRRIKRTGAKTAKPVKSAKPAKPKRR
jgi:hypothetical protein